MAGITGQLRAISGRPNGSSVDLWASGYYADSTTLHALVGHWNGTSWSLLSPSQAYVLNGIYAPATAPVGLGPNSVIGGGDDETPGHSQINPSSVITGTGITQWQSVPPVPQGTGTNLFFGVGGAPGGNVWGVGYSSGPLSGTAIPNSGASPAGFRDFAEVALLISADDTPTPLPTDTHGPTATATSTCGDTPPPGPSITPVLSRSLDPNYHSTIIAYDPNSASHGQVIRDTTIAGLIQHLLAPNGVNNCRDAKFMFQECFGGGMLSAVQSALGSTVKWVGGSASTFKQPSKGHEVGDNDPGDFWTESFIGGLQSGQSLLQELKYAKDHDEVANLETGQYTFANGGDSIQLADSCSESYHAILFAGYVDSRPGDAGMRHYNDIDAMRTALVNAWGLPNGTTVTIDVLFGDGQHKPDGSPLPTRWAAQPGTEAALDTAFEHLATLMNPNEQFFFYVSDHGGFQRDVFPTGNDNPEATATPVPLPPGGQEQDSFPLAQENLSALLDDTYTVPSLIISYTGSLDNNTAVSVSLNGSQVGYLQQGEVEVSLPVTKTLLNATNQVVLQSSNSTTIELNQETFDSGAVDTLLPASCTTAFTDVPSGSTFYPYIMCLSCAGMISGYPDGTFRPNNPVTRGQLSKIVSNASGYSDTYTTATFNDVPVGSTFFQYVQRLASRNIINGYQCGGQGEPCPGMYFRPGRNVTRGQTSKIVAIANGLPAPPSNQQSFEDVPIGSTFWTWIEALSSYGSINGYPCGGPGEPCDPQHKPYFRPGLNVSRGQAAKIVSKTYFPNCQVQ